MDILRLISVERCALGPVRERDFLRGLTVVYIATVYTHTLTVILYRN